MRRIFGVRKEKAPAPTLVDASATLDVRGSVIDEKIRKLDAELIKHREGLKKMRPGPAQEAAKQRALRVLKQKKLYESQRDQLYNQQYNIEQIAFTAENARDTAQQVQAMQAANKQLAVQFKSKDLDIDAIERMQDTMADLVDHSNEIQDALARNYAIPDDLDEEDLMGELDALEADLALEAEQNEGVPSYLQEDLPDVPVADPNAPLPVPNPAYPMDAYGNPVPAPQQQPQ